MLTSRNSAFVSSQSQVLMNSLKYNWKHIYNFLAESDPKSLQLDGVTIILVLIVSILIDKMCQIVFYTISYSYAVK